MAQAELPAHQPGTELRGEAWQQGARGRQLAPAGRRQATRPTGRQRWPPGSCKRGCRRRCPRRPGWGETPAESASRGCGSHPRRGNRPETLTNSGRVNWKNTCWQPGDRKQGPLLLPPLPFTPSPGLSAAPLPSPTAPFSFHPPCLQPRQVYACVSVKLGEGSPRAKENRVKGRKLPSPTWSGVPAPGGPSNYLPGPGEKGQVRRGGGGVLASSRGQRPTAPRLAWPDVLAHVPASLSQSTLHS